MTQIPQRILMTADTVGGVWTYAIELIREFEKYGIEVLLATMGAPVSNAQMNEILALGNVELAESHCRLEWMDDPWEDVARAGEWLLGLEEYFRPDLVHLNGYAHGQWPWRAPTLVAAHSCVLSWWKAVKGEAAPARWDRYRQEVRAGLQQAGLVVAPTGAMLNSLLENYGLLPRTQVISNGRRLQPFKPGRKENFILSAGRLWDEAKNVKAVCACSLDLPWPVCLAGETEPPLGGAGAGTDFVQARCLGQLSQREMIGQFSRAAIYAFPAKYEPFGLSVLEAALCGCALVLGDIPSLRENWNGAAIFVDPGDVRQLQKELSRLIEDPRQRARLAAAARERALQFDIHFTALRYLEAYRSIPRSKEVEEELCVPA